MTKAIETTGTLHTHQNIQLDAKLPSETPDRVRVIILYDDEFLAEDKKQRKSGTAAGQIIMSMDFDEPLEDFEDYI